MKKLLTAALALFASAAHANGLGSGLIPGHPEYQFAIVNLDDDNNIVFPPITTWISNTMTIQQIDENSGLVTPYVTLGETTLGCNSTNFGLTQTSGTDVVTCDGTNYQTLANQNFIAANYATLTGLGTQVTSLTTAINGKYSKPTGNTTQYVQGDGSLATFPTINNMTVYSGTTALSSPKLLIKAGNTNSSGQVVFNLTNDGTNTGTALIANPITNAVNVTINSVANVYSSSYAWSNSNKTLTVSLVQTGSLLGLGLIPFVSASTNIPVSIQVVGN